MVAVGRILTVGYREGSRKGKILASWLWGWLDVCLGVLRRQLAVGSPPGDSIHIFPYRGSAALTIIEDSPSGTLHTPLSIVSIK
jgi:hypothetical protein